MMVLLICVWMGCDGIYYQVFVINNVKADI